MTTDHPLHPLSQPARYPPLIPQPPADPRHPPLPLSLARQSRTCTLPCTCTRRVEGCENNQDILLVPAFAQQRFDMSESLIKDSVE